MEKDTRRFALASVVLGITAVTLFPIHAGLLDRLREIRPGFSPAPFLEGSKTMSLLDFLQNIVLFLPVGFLLADGRSGKAAWIRAACLSCLLSALIECAQIRVPGRFPSFWDIGFNTLGGVLGARLRRSVRLDAPTG
jgi:glycopeptide antibiotics resistance protein